MIDINLLPPNLRKKRKKKGFGGGLLKIPREAILGLVGGLFVLLLVLHILLQVRIFIKFAQHGNLKKQWEKIEPEKKEVDKVLSELRRLRKTNASIENITTGKRTIWASKLNAISDSIPRGVWLRSVIFEESGLTIEGSAVSKIKDEMLNVGSFVEGLKDQEIFKEDFTDFEVGSIQGRKLHSVDVADFNISAKLKSGEE